jgi:hypothetical protein
MSLAELKAVLIAEQLQSQGIRARSRQAVNYHTPSLTALYWSANVPVEAVCDAVRREISMWMTSTSGPPSVVWVEPYIMRGDTIPSIRVSFASNERI